MVMPHKLFMILQVLLMRCMSVDDPEETWNYLGIALAQKQWLVTANAYVKQDSLSGNSFALKDQSQIDGEQPEEAEKPSQQCFGIIEIKKIYLDDGSEERMIKLGNPWCSGAHMSDWGPNSDKWTPTVQNQLGDDDPQGGKQSFWMSLNHLVDQFRTGGCCKLYDKYLYSHLKLWHDDQDTESFIVLDVAENCHVFFGLSQKDERFFLSQNKEPKYQYSMARMIISKINTYQEIEEAVDGAYADERDMFVEATLTPGLYVAHIEMEWRQNYLRDIVFNTYGSARLIASEVLLEGDRAKFIEVMMTKAAGDNIGPENATISDYQHLGEVSIIRGIRSIHGYLVFYYKNSSANKGLREKIAMLSLSNLQILEPYTDNNPIRAGGKARRGESCDLQGHRGRSIRVPVQEFQPAVRLLLRPRANEGVY